MNTKPSRPIFLLGIVLVLISISCQTITQAIVRPTAKPTQRAAETTPPPALPTSATSPQPEATASPSIDLPASEVYAPPFADYPSVSVNMPSQAFKGVTLPVDASKLTNLKDLELSSQQQSLLAQNGFVVSQPVPGEYREFYQVYESYRYLDTQPLFVTTDAVFHVYHLIFDKMLRDLEKEYFIPDLASLTSSMLSASRAQYEELKGTNLEEPALRNVAFFAVAARLLNLPDQVPAAAQSLVNAELDLIDKHQGAAISPIWDRPDLAPDKKLIEDYGQYIPRGHYTRSEALKQYFKAMMWYGRLTFRLRDVFETRRSLLLIQALRTTDSNAGPSVQLWENIYEPTVFIVGKSDDLSYHEYGALSDKIFGANPDPSAFSSDQAMEQFTIAARQLPPPQINSMWVWITEDPTEATQGFRFMGQRFTLDEYVFGQLIWRRVGDESNPRMLPKGLDFFAAMGSVEALDILDQSGETKYLNYSKQMAKVQNEVSQLQIDSWTQNLYLSWLYAFQPVISPKDDRYPEFMRTQAWTRKDLNTALGSWTELKHDTILYAKQVMAEMGGGPPNEPPRGYVEPNPEAYARLLALVKMTQQGLESRSLLSDLTRGNLENLADLLAFLQDSSEKELAGEQLDQQAYDRIRYIGGELEALTLAASDRDEQTGSYRDLSDQKAALVADVATGADPSGKLVALTEAVGDPAKIFVVLPDQPYRVAVGAVFSYYEFVVPSEKRMTDEEWQAQVEEGTNPPMPDWTTSFVSP
ncbi:MAG: DUF3160 domain-containing protein [Chloroflexi bacterium]|nr:DUF3160 domain-containing protein [Chloroflexota bacterium]